MEILSGVSIAGVVMVVVTLSGISLIFVLDLTRGLVKKAAIDYIEVLQRWNAAKVDAEERETKVKYLEMLGYYEIRAVRQKLLSRLD